MFDRSKIGQRMHDSAGRRMRRPGPWRMRHGLKIPYAAAMGDSPSKAVLITGCSSGIGEATARRLAGGGWTVYATARRLEAIEHLQEAGCRTLALDVTDEASMQAAVDEVVRAEGAIGVLVNNAGYSQGGAIESVRWRPRAASLRRTCSA
jgi:NAD(P)-dependent dehydrogenase (short-subunit alcohol dehydrogenase family)